MKKMRTSSTTISTQCCNGDSKEIQRKKKQKIKNILTGKAEAKLHLHAKDLISYTEYSKKITIMHMTNKQC
jgi:hypothetical protein